MNVYTDSKRAAYLRGELTYGEYYNLLVDLLGYNALRRALPSRHGDSGPIERTAREWADLVAADTHLNNVALKHWDNQHWYIRSLLRQVDREDFIAIVGTGGWALSDTVCVLKCAARRYASEA